MFQTLLRGHHFSRVSDARHGTALLPRPDHQTAALQVGNGEQQGNGGTAGVTGDTGVAEGGMRDGWEIGRSLAQCGEGWRWWMAVQPLGAMLAEVRHP